MAKREGSYPIKSSEIKIAAVSFVQELKPADLLGDRACQNFVHDYYFVRPNVDGMLLKAMNGDKPILLSGDPASGKSRAIWELLQQEFPDAFLVRLICQPRLPNIIATCLDEGPKKLIETISEFEGKTFLVLDRLETFNEHRDELNEIFNLLCSNNEIVVVCTCESEKDAVAMALLGEISYNGQFVKVAISRLEEDEISRIEIELKSHIPKQIDSRNRPDVIGAYFLDLSQLKAYYQGLKKRDLEWEVLWAYRVVRFLRPNSEGACAAIVQYVNLRYLKYHQTKVPSPSDFDDAIDNLIQRGFLSWVSDSERGRVFMEPLCLRMIVDGWNRPALTIEMQEIEYFNDVIVVMKDFNEEKIADYKHLFSWKGADIQLNWPYNQLLVRITDPNLRKRKFDNMLQNGFKRDEVTYSIMMQRASSEQEVEGYYEEMIKAGLSPSNFSLNFVTRKYKHLNDAYKRYREIRLQGAKPDLFTLRIFIPKFNDFDDAWNFYEEVIRDGIDTDSNSNQADIQPEVYLYYSFIRLATKFSQVQLVSHEMNRMQIDRNGLFEASILRKQGLVFEEAKKVYEDLQRNSPELIDSHLLVSVLDSTTDYSKAADFFESEVFKLSKDQLMPSLFTCMIKKAADYETACKYFDLMMGDEFNLSPKNPHPFNALLRKTKSLQIALKHLVEMERVPSRIDANTYFELIRCCGSFKEGWHYLEEMRMRGIKPQLFLLNELLRKLQGKDRIKEAELAQNIYQIIQEEGLLQRGKRDACKRTFSLLVRKMRGFEIKMDLIAQVSKLDIAISESVLEFLARECENMEEGKTMMKFMENMEMVPTYEVCLQLLDLINRNPNYQLAHFLEFLEDLQEKNKVQKATLTRLFEVFVLQNEKVGRFEDSLMAFDTVMNLHIPISADALDYLCWAKLQENSGRNLPKVIDEINDIFGIKFIPHLEYFHEIFCRCHNLLSISNVMNLMDQWKVVAKPATFRNILGRICAILAEHPKDGIFEVVGQGVSIYEIIRRVLDWPIVSASSSQQEQDDFKDKLEFLMLLPFSGELKLKIAHQYNGKVVFSQEIWNVLLRTQLRHPDIAKAIGFDIWTIGTKSIRKFEPEELRDLMKFSLIFDEAKAIFERANNTAVQMNADDFREWLFRCVKRSEVQAVQTIIRDKQVLVDLELGGLLIGKAADDDSRLLVLANLQNSIFFDFSKARNFLCYELLRQCTGIASVDKALQALQGLYLNPLIQKVIIQKVVSKEDAIMLAKHLDQLQLEFPGDHFVENMVDLLPQDKCIKFLNSCREKFRLEEPNYLFEFVKKLKIGKQDRLSNQSFVEGEVENTKEIKRICRLIKFVTIYGFAITVDMESSILDKIRIAKSFKELALFATKSNYIFLPDWVEKIRVANESQQKDEAESHSDALPETELSVLKEKSKPKEIPAHSDDEEIGTQSTANFKTFQEEFESLTALEARNAFPFPDAHRRRSKAYLDHIGYHAKTYEDCERLYAKFVIHCFQPNRDFLLKFLLRYFEEHDSLEFIPIPFAQEYDQNGANLLVENIFRNSGLPWARKWQLVELLRSQNLQINLTMLYVLRDGAASFAELRQVIDLIRLCGRTPQVRDFERWLGYASSFADVQFIYLYIHESQVGVPAKLYSSMVQYASSWDEIQQLMQWVEDSGLSPEVGMLVKAFHLVQNDFVNGISIFWRLNKDYKLTPSAANCRKVLVMQGGDVQERWRMIEYMSRRGFKLPNEWIAPSLNCCRDIHNAKRIYLHAINNTTIRPKGEHLVNAFEGEVDLMACIEFVGLVLKQIEGFGELRAQYEPTVRCIAALISKVQNTFEADLVWKIVAQLVNRDRISSLDYRVLLTKTTAEDYSFWRTQMHDWGLPALE